MNDAERFKKYGFTDDENKAIVEAMNQSEEEKQKSLQWLIEKRDKSLLTLEWIKNQVNEYRKQAQNADNISQLELIQANIGRLIDYYSDLKAGAKYQNLTLATGLISKEVYLNTLKSGLKQLSGIMKMIEARKPYLRKNPKIVIPKLYKSKERTYGIALALGYYNKKIDQDGWESKKDLMRIAVDVLKIDKNEERAAKYARSIIISGYELRHIHLEKQKEKWPRDYNYAEELFKKYFKD